VLLGLGEISSETGQMKSRMENGKSQGQWGRVGGLTTKGLVSLIKELGLCPQDNGDMK
jgi:hypothetical protein